MAEAIALIVVGSGDTTADEVEDLLNDAYPEEEYEEVGLIVPVDKDLFTPAVKQVVGWYNSDKDVYPIQTKGASLGGRAASALGAEAPQKVDKFTEILTRDEFPESDWPVVHVLIAMPTDEEDPDYDLYAEIADLSLQAGFEVKNLCAALDDIVVTEPEDASKDEEPEVEPEKPTRRRRSRTAEKDEVPAAEPEEPVEEEKPARRSRKTSEAKKAASVEDVQEATKTPEPESEAALPHGDRIFALETEVRNLRDTLAGIAEVLLASAQKTTALPPEESAAVPEQEAEAPKRGRGRPRTDFDIRQVWSDEDDEWIPRPKGRLRKGTEWRTIHSETDEVLEQGTA